jgi:hypothetical protein
VRSGRWLTGVMLALTCAASALISCGRSQTARQPAFAAPEDAARALVAAAKAGPIENVAALFGPDGAALIDSSDPVMTKRNREVFSAAAAERWRLVDQGTGGKVLVIGNEEWPFAVPLTKDTGGWRFDTATGKEEVLDRRIGRNELAAIRICRTYVAAQRLYAENGHDGRAAGLYARTFRSDPGRQNGLYWPVERGQKRSPLGALVADAAADPAALDRARPQSSPFHGYQFKILAAQGAGAPGGARDYVVAGAMSGGFAMVAWPAQYDVTGIMTFVVNQDGVLHERDLGSGTGAAASGMTLYNPDASWAAVQ